ncbi:MAG: hypothetical protein ACI97N_000650 [Cognaticolwellia sp.]|jgi:hypothetical protein|tara:strand:+ start:57 stop:203 length:147 start_codon:yes stop_codon:yes gene_type:complete
MNLIVRENRGFGIRYFSKKHQNGKLVYYWNEKKALIDVSEQKKGLSLL